MADIQQKSERIHGLDAVRALALILGLVVHGSMAFLPGSKYFWITSDPNPSSILSVAFYVPHMFRMILFFLLAGFFGRMSLQRLGTKNFIKDRSKRIVAVLFMSWPIVFAGIVFALTIGALMDNHGSLPKESPPSPKFTPDDFPLTHLWFLYILTFCYAIMLVALKMLALIDRENYFSRIGDLLIRLLTSSIGPFILAIPLAASLFFSNNWYHWFGIPTPDQKLYPNLSASIAFGSAFLFGWNLHRQKDCMNSWQKHAWQHFVAAVIGTSICLYIVGLSSPALPAAKNKETLAYAMLYAWTGWSWTVAITGLALRYVTSVHKTWRYIADASYWIYLAHIPVIMILQVLATRTPGPVLLKFGIVVFMTFFGLLGLYHVMVRNTWIGVLLNGKRANTIQSNN